MESHGVYGKEQIGLFGSEEGKGKVGGMSGGERVLNEWSCR